MKRTIINLCCLLTMIAFVQQVMATCSQAAASTGTCGTPEKADDVTNGCVALECYKESHCDSGKEDSACTDSPYTAHCHHVQYNPGPADCIGSGQDSHDSVGSYPCKKITSKDTTGC